MKKKRILFIYRTPRKAILEKWKRHQGPDSLLFGFNHIKKFGYEADFSDSAYSIFNPYHPIFYPFEHAIINKVGMGFKLDQALFLLSKIRNYDVIIGTGDSAGLPILALKYFGLIKKPIIFMTAGLAGALDNNNKNWVGNFYRKILPEADIFTTYSQVETDFFENQMGIKKGKINYLPLGTDWEYFSKSSTTKKNIISAVGVDSGRDYSTFFKSVENLQYPIEIACHPSNIRGLKIPNNVKVHLNAPIEKVRDIFQRSLISVIPCYERFRSAGQMVLLESSSSAVPIIASKIRGITQAFKMEDNKHLIFVKPQDPKDLEDKIIYLLKNPQVAHKLGKNASIFVKKNYTTKHLARNLAKHIENL